MFITGLFLDYNRSIKINEKGNELDSDNIHINLF